MAFCGLIALVMTSKYTHDVSSLVLVQGGLLLSTVMSVNWIFVAYQRMELQSACEMAEKFLYVVFLFGAFLFYRNLLVIPWAMVVASLLAGCAGWVLLRRELPARRWGFDRGFFRELLLKSWPVGLSNAASRINTNLDTIFIQIYWGGELTGHYNAAYKDHRDGRHVRHLLHLGAVPADLRTLDRRGRPPGRHAARLHKAASARVRAFGRHPDGQRAGGTHADLRSQVRRRRNRAQNTGLGARDAPAQPALRQYAHGPSQTGILLGRQWSFPPGSISP